MGKSDLASASLVACVDGPMAGMWFHQHDWIERLHSAAYMRDVNNEPPQPCLGYRPADWTADPIQHPHLKTVTGHALYYRDASRTQDLATAYPTRTTPTGYLETAHTAKESA